MVTRTPITELDFNSIKSSIKTYLKAQDQFKDYDFEGSNLAVLIDILAYNTFQNNWFSNMALSEMFLDSAQVKESVISHAKELNYLPASRSSAKAVIDVSLNVADSPLFVTIPAKTKFTARCGNQTFNFYNDTSATIYPVNGVYSYLGLEVFEGQYVTEFFEVNGDTSQQFILSNDTIDIDSLELYVLDNSSDTTGEEYMFKANLFGVLATDKVYFLQSATHDRYQVTFGLDVFGKQPVAGNIIRATYRITSGEEANGITSISAPNTIHGYPAVATLRTSSRNGQEREGLESIRYFAPRSIQIQERAVTENDYEILLKNNFPQIQAISVYGGEEADPPQYGRVMIAIDEQGADGVSISNKAKYEDFIRERSPLAVTPMVVSPGFMYIAVNTRVYYNTTTTNKSSADVREIVRDAILDFSDTYLADFEKTFRYSKFISSIDNSDANIMSNETTVKAVLEISPAFGQTDSYVLPFKNQLVTANTQNSYTPAVQSSTFVYQGNSSSFIRDDGTGLLHIVTPSSSGAYTVLNTNAGTVDYTTGRVALRPIEIDSYAGSAIKFYGQVRSRDIIGPRDRIISIREEDLSISVIGSRP